MNNDELDFREIYDNFQPRILRYLTRLVGKNAAEDLTQHVFLKVSQALKTFRGESKLSTWIYRIATNAALDKLRSPSFQRIAQEKALDDSIAISQTVNVETSLIRKEMNECIRSFVENLPTNYRTVIVLSELEGLKNTEIAEILCITLGTVKTRLHRARKKLKKELETHCNFYRDERNELACDLKSAFEGFRKVY